MYPLTLIRISKNKKIRVELKNNELYEGTLSGCDLMMNMCLKNVNVKKHDEPTYFILECYLKGSAIKHVELNKDVLNVQGTLEVQEKKRKGKV